MSNVRLIVWTIGLIGWLLASPALAAEAARQQVAVVGATVEGGGSFRLEGTEWSMCSSQKVRCGR